MSCEKSTRLLLPLVALFSLMAVSCTAVPKGDVDTEARTLVEAVSAKLAAAETIRIRGTRSVDEQLLGAAAAREEVDFVLCFARPNRVHVRTTATSGGRLLLYDGAAVTLVDEGQKLYATAELEAADATELAAALSRRFGFYPPVAEFLAADPAEALLDNVRSGTVTTQDGDHLLSFVQEGLEWEMLVSGESHLPTRLVICHTAIAGSPKLEVTFSDWELGADLSGVSYGFDPGDDHQKIEIVPVSGE